MQEKKFEYVEMTVKHPNGRMMYCSIPVEDYTNTEILGNVFKNMKWVFDKDEESYTKHLEQEAEGNRRCKESWELHKKLGNV